MNDDWATPMHIHRKSKRNPLTVPEMRAPTHIRIVKIEHDTRQVRGQLAAYHECDPTWFLQSENLRAPQNSRASGEGNRALGRPMSPGDDLEPFQMDVFARKHGMETDI